ncbi:IPT/TIG domain-containing protein [Adhaeribacter sp. BT258]|uniref:IPT/TIG domain-containing protein n=1 Tax=Adhaeribacter terrigena TaxID=2793070 RepID=A0ABS1C3Y5_9BACT|nr:IPT/TIG domain-containing protein [Adhaeribacter terrigena]MBK0403323.1 IPT/TIG domain-containing protein [Adhaeribacter terrigena]
MQKFYSFFRYLIVPFKFKYPFVFCQLVALFCCLAVNSNAQQLLPPGPQTDGTVNVTYRDGGIQYVGGSFSTVGYKTGSATLFPGSGNTPNLNFPQINGTVYCSAPDGTGGWYLGGSFTQAGGVSRSNLVHITAANTVNPSFQPNPNSTVYALLLHGSALYAGGDFTTLGGLVRNRLGAVNASTGAALAFDPNLDNTVNTLALNGANLLAGGTFQRVSGNLCPHLAAFSTATGQRVSHTQADGQVTSLLTDGTTTYAGGAFQGFGYNTGYSALLSSNSNAPSAGWPTFNGTVNITISDGSGGWYVGGAFTKVGNVSIRNLVHITATNDIDPIFKPEPNGTVTTLLRNGATIYAGGDFTIIGKEVRNRLAELDPVTGTATSINPDLDSRPNALAIAGSRLYVGGAMNNAQGNPARNLVAYDLTTGLRTPYPGANGAVLSLLADGSNLFVGGSFSGIGFYTGYSAQLSTSSDVPSATWPVINGTVYVTIPDGNGGWYVGGSFSQVGSTTIRNLVHITATNTIDAAFKPEPNGGVYSLLKNGTTLYVGGDFNTIGGQSRNRLAAVNAGTGAATNLDLSTSNRVRSLTLVGTTLYAGGDMLHTQGFPTRYLTGFNVSTGELVKVPGFNSQIKAMATDGTNIYAAGSHTQTGISAEYAALLSISSDVPSANWPYFNGTIYAVAGDGNGGWYVGGSFSEVAGQPRRNLVRLLANGTIDPVFAPDPNSTVHTLALKGSTLYTGGSFNQIGGNTRTYLAAVNAVTGALLPLFDAAPNSTVTKLAVSDDALYVGGSFSQIGGQTRNRLASLDLTSGSAGTWNPNPNSTVNDILVDTAAGTLYVAGSFSQIGGQTRQYLVAFDLLTHTLSAFAPNPNSTVYSLALSGADLFVGGSFSTIGGQNRQYLAALNKNTGTPSAFNPQPNSTVQAIATDGTSLFIGGSFTRIGNLSGSPTRNYLAAFTLNTGSLSSWDPAANSSVTGITLAGAGMVVTGSFNLLKTTTDRPYLAAFDAVTGQLNSGFAPVFSSDPGLEALTLHGATLYAGGSFNINVNGQNRRGLAAFDKTTGIATSFNPQLNSRVNALATDGTTLFAGGDFTQAGSSSPVTRNRLAAFDLGTGTLTNWNPNANSAVYALGMSGAQVVTGGSFTYLKSHDQNGLISLDAVTGATNTGFAANFNYYFYGYAPQTMVISGNTLYVGGYLYQYKGAMVSNILGLDKSTGTLSGFAPNLNNTVYQLATDGTTLFAAGEFTQAGTISRNRLASFTLSNGALTSWDPNANSSVRTLALDGTQLLIGGSFTYLNYQAKARLASLTSTGHLNTAFSPPAFSNAYSAPVSGMLISGGKLYVAGDFYSYTNSNSVNRNFSSITAFDKVTGFDDGSFTIAFGGGYGQAKTITTDGTTLFVGGDFTQVGTGSAGIKRNRLAAFTMSNGSLASWDPGVNNTVHTLSRSGSDLLAGGSFNMSNAFSRSGLFAYSVRTGEILPGFNANLAGPVYALTSVGSRLFVGGAMYTNGSNPKGGLLAIDKLTGADTGFNSGLYSSHSYAGSAPVHSLAVSGSTLYVGGDFYNGYGAPRNYLAAYNLNTDALISGFNPNLNGRVKALALDGTTLYVGGEFTTINGQTRNRLSSFDIGTNSLTSWNPGANSTVFALGVNTTALYAGGYFSIAGGQNRYGVAAIDKVSGTATSWDPGLNSHVEEILATDTRVILGGAFTQANGQPVNRAAIYGASGNAPVFTPQFNNSVLTFSLNSDTLLTGGSFTTANGETRQYMAGFTLDATPTIISFSPVSGPAGTVVTVTGSGFTGVTSVTLNGVNVPVYNVTSTTQFTFTVPAGATTGLIAVTAATGTGTSSQVFTVLPAVAITSFTPTSGKAGDAVNIYGNGFTGATSVTFNGTAVLSPSVYSNTHIYAVVPVGATTGPIAVTSPAGTGTSDQDFVVIPSPTITSFSPGSGPSGTMVTITGTNFGGLNAVKFNGTNASNYTLISSTTITAEVPGGATSGSISVTAAGGTGTSASSFTVVTSPEISSFWPPSGPAGTVVTIYGNYFTNATEVSFNGANALAFNVVNSTQINATVPVGATDGLIRVTTPSGTATSATIFDVTPSVTVSYAYGPSNSYNAAAIGNTITVHGSGFSGATSVEFNGGTGTNLVVTSSSQLTVTVPVGAQTGPISVTTPFGTGTMTTDFNIIPAPTITSFTPSFATVGSLITIYGTGYASGGTVTFGGNVNATYLYNYGPNFITVAVPTGASTGLLSVTTLGGTATSATVFTVVGAPTITAFSPDNGLPGTSVTITGTNLTGTNQVNFNGTPATFSNVTSTSLTAVVPANATTGPIAVYTPAGYYTTASNGAAGVFTVLSLVPTISSFTPTGGPEGTLVTVSGTNFTGATSVTVGGVPAISFSVQSATSLTLYIPTGAITGPIVITNPSGTATSATNFTVVPAPVITSVSPNSEVVGASVVIYGSNFQNASYVGFNGTSAPGYVVNSSGTEITVTVPAGATTGQIRVTTPGGTTYSSSNFTVLVPAPTITTFSPASGPINTAVTITGTNFTNVSSVRFNGIAAGFTQNSATSITATVPIGTSTGPITVTTPGGTATSATDFIFIPAPVLSSLAPTSGGAGTVVTLSGGNFQNTSAVRFNGALASGYVVNGNGTQITVSVPAGASTGPVSVTTPGGTATSTGNFTVLSAPTISGFTPASGPAGTNVVITGTNLNTTTGVNFNGTLAGFTVNSATQLTATVPATATTGFVTVISGGGSNSSADPFTVIPTTLAAFDPVCETGSAFSLSGGSPAGGTYSGPGVSSNQFNPATAGVGTHTITYTYTLNSIITSATQTLNVEARPTVTLASQNAVCQGTAAFNLGGGSPAGGTYSGTGVSGGQFNPAVAGVGTHAITYAYTNAAGCSSSAIQQLTVLPTPTFASSATQVCSGQPVTLTVSNAGAGATYAWSTGETTASITASPTVQTTYSVTVTNAAGCTYPFSQQVTINPFTSAPGVVSQLQPVDNSNGLSLPITFSWNGTGQVSTYDLYIWPVSGLKPVTPTAAGINSLQYTFYGTLPYGAQYNWQVVAKNTCFTTNGPVLTFGLRELPDLRITLIQNPDTVYAGQTMQMSWNVTNFGLGSTLAQQWRDEVWLSQDSAFNAATAIRVGDWGNTTFLQANATYITNATFPVPYSQAGYYYVFVKANTGSLLETNLNNNRLRATGRTLMIVPTTPDLTVENFVSPPDPSVSYTDVTMRYNVYNRGSVAAIAHRYDEFFISPDTILNISQNTGRLALGPNAISLGRRLVTDTLLTNGHYQRTVTVRIPHTEFGTRYFYAYTDTDNQLFETASTNNVNRPVPVEIILRPPADLIPIALNAPANMIAGATAAITWDVRNAGNNPPVAEERYWSDNFWLSPTATFDPATAIPVGTLNIFGGDTLGVQHHYRRSVNLNIPNGISGTYYVFGHADYVAGAVRGNVFEYNQESNNMLRSGAINVGLTFADLNPAVFNGPTSVDAFQTFTINYTVQNTNSAVGAASGSWTDAVWLHNHNSSAANCSPLATVTRSGPLAPGATYSGTMTVSIPRYIDPGTYDLVLRTDNGGTVYEYNLENNNDLRYTFTYNYSDDLELTALATSGAALSGQTIQVNFSVENQGAFRTLATGWADQFYLSADASLDASDLLLNTVTRNGDLNIGESYNGSTTVRMPHGLQGNYFLIGKAGVRDGRGTCNGIASSVLVDTDPANNFRTIGLPITLTPPSDLIPVTYTLPTDVVAGQQVTIPFTIQNQGTGATLEGNWDDGIYLNTSPTVNGAVRIGTVRHAGTRGAGQSYSTSITTTIPAYMAGNYYIFLVTDISGVSGYIPSQHWGGAVQYGTVYEHQQELNNVVQGSILIRVPQPADLVVTSVTIPANRKLGEMMTVHYEVKNQGVNPAIGQLKDGLFLSLDATLNGAIDQLFATSTGNVVLAPNQTFSGTVRSRLQGLMPGTYHGLMATNLFNDIYEGLTASPAANNNVTGAGNQLDLGVNVLPLRTPTSFPLMKDSVVYYQVNPGENKDMVLTLTSNHSLGQNEMYVAYNRVPTPADYDFIYLNQVSTSQEILVPTTGALPYYVLVKTPYQYSGLQTATLYADTLGFQVRSITANKVGRGRVTTQVLGAGFRRLKTGTNGYPATRYYLTKGNNPAIRAEAQVLKYHNSTEVTLRWRLDTLSVGLYNVVADNNGTRVQLTNGLTVEPAQPLNVDFATIIPQVVRVNSHANWTYFLQNNSNVDVPYWEFQYELPPGQNPVITHTPNVRKKSDFYAGAASSTLRNRMDNGLTEVLPFVARDLRPGEIIQVNLRLTPTATGGFPVVWNQAALTEEWYTRQTLDHIDRYRAAVLAKPADFPAGVANLAANATAWQDSLRRYYVSQGLLDTIALKAPKLRTGYTALSNSVQIPGGVCGTWGVTECVRPFRPDPFDANVYPAALIGCADSIVFTYKGRGVSCTQVVGSLDPNLIAGPSGTGQRKMVGNQQRLSYQVQFENDPLLATAPAQVVRVTVPLNPAFDAQQFRLGSFGWGNYLFETPPNSSSYTSVLDMPDSLGYDVRVLGTVDVVGRRLIWQFETLDPATGVAPADPNKGFLLVNDSTGRGQGFINYTIKASPTAVTGDTLAAQATIVFDSNPPLATNRWVNLLDAVAPTSLINALPLPSVEPSAILTWAANDDTNGSGLLTYDLYVSQDGGPFEQKVTGLTDKTYTFNGEPKVRYEFFVLARDSAENQEAMKSAFEAVLFHDPGTPLPVELVSFKATRKGQDALLEWQTAEELDNAGFEVEVSEDGRTFRKLQYLEAKGRNSHYSYLDAGLNKKGMRYYRLKQLDLDESFSYSPIRTLDFGDVKTVTTAWPNPFSSNLFVKLTTQIEEPVTLVVTDVLGRVRYKQEFNLKPGNHQVELELAENLPAGLYLLEVIRKESREALKVIRK